MFVRVIKHTAKESDQFNQHFGPWSWLITFKLSFGDFVCEVEPATGFNSVLSAQSLLPAQYFCSYFDLFPWKNLPAAVEKETWPFTARALNNISKKKQKKLLEAASGERLWAGEGRARALHVAAFISSGRDCVLILWPPPQGIPSWLLRLLAYDTCKKNLKINKIEKW